MIRGTIDEVSYELYTFVVPRLLDTISNVANYIYLLIDTYNIKNVYIACTLFVLIIVFYYILKNMYKEDEEKKKDDDYISFLEGNHNFNRRVLDRFKIPHPNDNTENKELARIVRRQILVKTFLLPRESGWTILSEKFRAFDCYLDEEMQAKLNNIAREAELRDELSLLGFKLVNVKGVTRLCDLARKGPFEGTVEPYAPHLNKTALPRLNVYLLVIGKISPEGKRELLGG